MKPYVLVKKFEKHGKKQKNEKQTIKEKNKNKLKLDMKIASVPLLPGRDGRQHSSNLILDDSSITVKEINHGISPSVK